MPESVSGSCAIRSKTDDEGGKGREETERRGWVVLFRVVLAVSGVAKPSPWLTLLLTHKECNASFC